MKKRILVIDDDLLIRYGLERGLSQAAVEVVTAATAGAAMQEMRAGSFDLCLLDIHLPDRNGLELLATIRQLCPKTRVIIMTASLLDDVELSDNIRQAAANGASHFIPKPFELSAVREIIARALA